MFPNADREHQFHAVRSRPRTTPASAALGTVPVLGWVSNSTQYACSFTEIGSYPDQQGYRTRHICGNGSAYGVTPRATEAARLQAARFTATTRSPQITSTPEPAPSITDLRLRAPGRPVDADNVGRWHLVGRHG